jgi:hypothetical protein
MIVDSELMPWSLLGKGLIEESFGTVGIGLQAEQAARRAAGFELALEEEQETAIYLRQLELYGKSGPANFQCFGILRMTYEDGRVELPEGQIANYEAVNDNEHLVVDLRDFPAALAATTAFFQRVTTEDGEEGVVLKPDITPVRTVPFMKVRNPEYLSIIFGPHYRRPDVYAKHIAKKNIRKKLQISLEEWALGCKILLAKDDDERRKLFCQFLFQEELEKGLDARM